MGGFTLFELLMALLIFVVAAASLVAAQEGCLTLAEGARNLTTAMNGVRERTEVIRNANFAAIAAMDGTTFTVPGWNVAHMGSIRVDATDTALLQVFVSISWRQKSGRIIGEDVDLDGYDVAEDVSPANGRLDSPASYATLRADI